jgi:transcriptional regulator with GAF, ATPase, and Fis domain
VVLAEPLEPPRRSEAEDTTRSPHALRAAREAADAAGPARGDPSATPTPPSLPPAGGAAKEGAPVEAARLWRLVELARALNSTFNLEEILDRVADAALETLDAERAFIVLRDGAERRFQVSRNFDREEVRDPEGKVSKTLLEQVLETGRSVIAEDAGAEEGTQALASVGRLKLRSLLCVPIRVKGRVEGAIYIDNRFRRAAFADGERRVLEALADACGIAIENARLVIETRAARARAEEESAGLRDAVQSQRIELSRLTQSLASGAPDPALRHEYGFIIGRSPPMKRVLALIDRVTTSDIPVLVTGESGTGKELVARALHRNGSRKDGPFVTENFAAIPESLGEAELFGHVKGAYTGAVADRPGLFELANKGTLFLDEVGEMSQNLQKKLLRVLQEGEVRRVGGQRSVAVDVRIVAATNKDLLDAVRKGEFREDLYYRLNVVEVKLPPLRERMEDTPALVDHFLAKAADDEGKPKRGISREALRHLARRPWPGNVRELENAIRRLAALGSDVISQRDVLEIEGEPGRGASTDRSAFKTIDELEREHIERVLAACSWKPTEAARILGISYTTLWRKMKAYGFRSGPRK